MVFLGDYIDRGPQSKACVDEILTLQNDLPSELVCLCGNHEDWLLRTRHDYRHHSWLLGMDGLDTIRSYSIDAADTLRDAMSAGGLALYEGQCALPYDLFFDRMPDAHRRFFDSLQTYHKSPDCVCSHGGLDSSVPRIEDQTRAAWLWGAGGFPHRYEGADAVVYGHWNNAVLDARGWPSPLIQGRTIGIDTIAHGVLTAIRLPDQRVFQSARHVLG